MSTSVHERLRSFASLDLTTLSPAQAVELRSLLKQAAPLAENESEEAAALSAVRAARDLAWVKDTDGRYLWANRAYCELCGTALERLTGCRDYEIWPSEYAERMEVSDRLVVQQREPSTRLEPLNKPDGSVCWLETVRVPLIGDDGHVTSVSGISRDVSGDLRQQEVLRRAREELEDVVRVRTSELRHSNDTLRAEIAERERAEHSLRHTEEKLLQLASSINDVIWLSESGQIVYVSPAYEDIWECSCTSLYEQPDSFMDAIHPDDRERFIQLYQGALLKEEGRLDADFRIVLPGKEHRWIHMQMFPIRDGSGRIYRRSAVARDISDRQRMIEELRRSSMEAAGLNQELLQINSQLEQAIVQANEMALKAESASHTKSQFLANMSHEIRTPLNAVLGMLSLMDDTPLTEQQKDYLNTVRQSSETLLDIINDILDFSKIEAGKIEFESIAFSLYPLVRDTLNLLHFRADQKRLELSCQMDTALPPVVVGDPTRLRQVLINLVSNAVKFTHKGFIRVGMKVEEVSQDRVRIIGNVQDSGIGIPKDRQDRLFRPFSQVDSSTTRQYGGTGLGLAISSRLCNLMNGHMWVESEPGHGTNFLFSIELALPETNAVVEPEVPQVRDEPENDPTQLRLLLAEDNPVNRKVATLLLKRAGYTPDIAENGKQVLERFRKQFYDVILMDVQMPEMDGIEATRKLRRRIGKGPQPYIVALTASAGKHDRDRCLEAGMDTFLSKPIRVNELMEVLKYAPLGGAHHDKHPSPDTADVS